MMTCPLCGSTGSEAWHTLGQWPLRRCHDCGLGRLDPQPSAAELDRLYGAAYFDGRQPLDESRAASQMGRSFARRLRLIRRFTKSGQLLDAGCGEGKWLAFARDAGFDASGFDVSADAAVRAGLNVVVGPMGAAPVQGPFDVITAWHSLEHTPNPLAALRWLNSLLKPGGLLVVEVPNCESDDARHLGESWDGWQPPFHLWHFAPATLRRALAQTGFAPLAERYDSSRWARRRLWWCPFLNGMLAHFWTGTALTIAARKETAR
jgi:SAM-dependent methyltransferase